MDKSNKPKKAWYKRIWVWIGIIVLIAIIGSAMPQKDTPSTPSANTPTTETPKEETAEWDIEAVYAKIKDGMTKKEVEEVTAKESESCTESSNEYTGKTELCTYGNAFIDKGSITVTYSQDKVSGKTKSKF